MITVLGNVAIGVLLGLGVAAVFSLLAGILALLSGSGTNPTYGVPTLLVVRAYFLAGGVAGVVYGLLRPVTRTRAGAILVGIVVALLAQGVIGAAVRHSPSWSNGGTIAVVALLGAAVGWVSAWLRPRS